MIKKFALILILLCMFTNNASAVFVVTDPSDSTTGNTLRNGITQLNAGNVPDGQIHINLPASSTIILSNGNLPPIQRSVLISGGNTSGLTINGNTHSIFFVYGANSPTVEIDTMTLFNATSLGGSGGAPATGGGGGAMGAGGAIFVDANATVNVNNVNFTLNRAQGGAGAPSTSTSVTTGGGGGGGMLGGNGGNGGTDSNVIFGQGAGGGGGGGLGGIGGGGAHQNSRTGGSGGAGILVGQASGGRAASPGGIPAPGGPQGGGGGGGGNVFVEFGLASPAAGGGGGPGGQDGNFFGTTNSIGGNGAVFGGGGGSASLGDGGTSRGGNGGFGGGGGGTGRASTMIPGAASTVDGLIAGGAGGVTGQGGSGGSGFGGAVFVRQGGTLNFQNTINITNSSVTVGANAPGAVGGASALGEALYIMGGTTTNFNMGGQTDTITNSIAGAGSIVVNDTAATPGTLIFNGTTPYSYSGGTTVTRGTLQGNTTTLQGNITNNATVIFNQFGVGTYAGVMTGSGTLVKNGAGTLILSSANNFNALTVNAGTVDLTANQTINTIAGVGVLQLDATLTLGSNNSSSTYDGRIIGLGTIDKRGSGSLTLTGLNNFGGLAINGGIVNLSTHNQSIANLTGVGGTTLNLNGITLTVSQSSSNVDTLIQGTGGITKIGPGTLTLTNSNNFGPLAINGGTVVLMTNNQTITDLSGSGALVTNVNLTLGSANSSIYTGSITGPGGLTKVGSGILTLADGTNIGHLTINAGTVRLTGNMPIIGDLSGSGSLETSSVVQLGSGNNTTFSGPITGIGGNIGGGLFKVGTGTLTLSGPNKLNSLFIEAGEVDLTTNNQTIQLLNGGGTLRLTGINLTVGDTIGSTFNGQILGTGGITKVGADTLTLGGSNNFGFLTINGGTVHLTSTQVIETLAGNGSLIIDQNLTVGSLNTSSTFGGPISGGGGLFKAGSGTLILTGHNTYTGGTLVAGGILQGNTNSLQGNITNNATVIFDQTFTGTYSGNMSGSGQLIKQNIGTLILTGFNTYTGGTTVSGGILQGNTNSLQGNILNNATVVFDQNINGTYAGVMSGTGHLTKQGTGNLILAGANTYSGGTTLTAGTLTVNNNSALGSGPLTLNGGVLQTTVNGTTIGNNFTVGIPGSTINGSADLTLSGTGTLIGNLTITNTATTTLSGLIQGSGRITMNSNTGNLVLSGVNTFTGGINFISGTITANNTNALGTGVLTVNSGNNFALLQTTVVGGVTLNNGFVLNGGSLNVGGSQNFTLTGNGILGNGFVFFVNNTATTTLSGIISGSGGISVSGGAGTLVLSNSNTYSGNTFVGPGATIVANHDNALGIGGTLSFNGGTLMQTVGGTVTLRNGFLIGGTGTIGGENSITLTGAGTISGTLNVTNLATTTLSGPISNGFNVGSIVLNAPGGTLILLGKNTYTGGTTVLAGTLQGNTNSLQGNIVDNDTVVFDQSFTGVYAGVISGTGSVVKQNIGTLILTGANTYTGGTVVNGGVLQGNTTSLQGDIINDASVVFDQAFDGAYTGEMSGTGSLTKQNVGALILSGANTYSGGTILKSGTLIVNNNSALGTGLLSLNGGVLQTTVSGTNISNPFSVNALTFTIDGAANLTLSGPGTLNGNLNITNAATTTLSGSIGGSRIINMNSPTGNLILSGSNGFLGGVVLNSGTLTANNNAALGAGRLTLNGGVLQTTVSGTVLANNFTVGTGGSTIGGSSNLTLTGAGILLGPLTVTNTATTTLSGALSGTGSLTMNGAGGTLLLSGINTYSGGTTVLAGTLRLGSSGSIRADSNLTINGGVFDLNNNSITVATLSGTGGSITLGTGTLTAGYATDSVFAGSISGSGGFVKQGTSTLTFTGTNTYTGGTTVNVGTLRMGSATAFPSGTNLTVNGGVFDLNNNAITVGDLRGGGGTISLGSGNLTVGTATPLTAYTGNIVGTGGLTKIGSGTLVLSNPNYTGSTAVNAGVLSLAGGLLSGPITIANDATFDFAGGTVTGAITGGPTSAVTISRDTTTNNTISVGTLTVRPSTVFLVNNPITVANAFITELNGVTLLNNTINGNFVNDGFLVLASGQSITGNYTQSQPAAFATVVQSPTDFGRIQVGGTATIQDNSNILVGLTNTFTLRDGTMLDIITAGSPPNVNASTLNVQAGLFVGPADLLTFVNSPFDFVPIVVGNSLRLVAIANANFLSENIQDPVALVMANVFERMQFTFNLTPGLQRIIFDLAMLPDSALTAALKSTAPITNGGLFYTNLTALDEIFYRIENFTKTMRASADDILQGVYVAGDGCNSDGSLSPFILGSGQNQRALGFFDGYNANTYGGGLLGDADITNRCWDGCDIDAIRLGGALAYTRSKVNFANRDNSFSYIDTAHVLVFGSIVQDLAFLNIQLDVGRNWYHGQRTIAFGTTKQSAHAQYGGTQFAGKATLGYMMWDLFETTPEVSILYTGVNTDGYTESNAGSFNLAVSPHSTHLIQLAAGVNCRYTVYRDYVVPEFHAFYIRDINTPLLAVTAQFAEIGPTFVVPGPGDAKNTLNVGFGLTSGLFRGCLQFNLTYDFRLKKNYTNHTGFVRARWLF